MVSIGRMNKLKVLKDLDFGVYLFGEELGEILLPRRYVPQDCTIGSELDVFLYFDSADRIIATTEKPFAMVGECAWLQVKSVDQVGAFLDWGLMKDLFVPFREQASPMKVGEYYMVQVYFDEDSQRIAASSRLDRLLHKTVPEFGVGEKVDLQIWQKTELGYKAIIHHSHIGILYSNEVFEELKSGQKIEGYIKKIREDGKIDLSLWPQGYGKIDALSSRILEYLESQGGQAELGDHTSPEKIYNLFGISKKNFKKVLGKLYREGFIAIEKDEIRLISSEND